MKISLQTLRELIREEFERATINEAVKAQVNTDQYEFAHGKKPKGTGRWAFRFENHRNGQDGEIWFAPGNLPYAKALAAAHKEAESEGASFIFVMP